MEQGHDFTARHCWPPLSQLPPTFRDQLLRGSQELVGFSGLGVDRGVCAGLGPGLA